jgi:hypothetical protein
MMPLMGILADKTSDLRNRGYDAGTALRDHAAQLLPAYRIIRHLGAARWLKRVGNDPALELESLRTAAQ